MECALPGCDGKVYRTNKRYCSKTCAKTAECKRYRNRIKSACVKAKGGKCQGCGYDKCLTALDFHHKDKTKKERALSDMIGRISINAIGIELKKCVLVCSNCHREIHDGVRKSPRLRNSRQPLQNFMAA